MINKEFGKFVPTCDICEDTLPPEETFWAAVDAKEDAGWARRKVEHGTTYDWIDVCHVCKTAKDEPCS